MSLIKTNAIQTLAGKPILNATGSVLQVLSTTKTDTFSASGTSFNDITGMSVTITPSSSSSKVLVIAQCAIVCADSTGLQLVRGSTAIAVPDTSGSRFKYTMIGLLGTGSNEIYNHGANHINFLDSPSTTSATTYKLQGVARSGSYFINTTIYQTDNDASGVSTSTITVMEIAG